MESLVVRWRKSLLWLVVAWITGALIAACGGGGGSPGANPTTGALSVGGGVSAVTLLPGESKLLPVTGGVPPYRAVTSEAAVAVAAMDGNTLVIGGTAPGSSTGELSTTVTVTDRAGTSVGLTVKVGTSVPLYTTAPNPLTISVDEEFEFRILGGVKPYTVRTPPTVSLELKEIAGPDGRPSEDHDRWVVKGLSVTGGNQVPISILDKVGKSETLNVVVATPRLEAWPAAMTLPVGMVGEVRIRGGRPPYRVLGVPPQALQIERVLENGFRIRGLVALGATDIVFADEQNQTTTVRVTVENVGPAVLGVSPISASLAERSGTSVTFRVYTRAGSFTPFSENRNLVTIESVVPPTFSGGVLIEPGSFVARVPADNNACVNENQEIAIFVLGNDGSLGGATVNVVNVGNRGDADSDPNCPP